MDVVEVTDHANVTRKLLNIVDHRSRLQLVVSLRRPYDAATIWGTFQSQWVKHFGPPVMNCGWIKRSTISVQRW